MEAQISAVAAPLTDAEELAAIIEGLLSSRKLAKQSARERAGEALDPLRLAWNITNTELVLLQKARKRSSPRLDPVLRETVDAELRTNDSLLGELLEAELESSTNVLSLYRILATAKGERDLDEYIILVLDFLWLWKSGAALLATARSTQNQDRESLRRIARTEYVNLTKDLLKDMRRMLDREEGDSALEALITFVDTQIIEVGATKLGIVRRSR